ncbi:hypothetical protein FQV11_0013780, partial [Eudyptes moseleyi]
MFSLRLKEVVSISRTFDLRCSRRPPQRGSGSRLAGGPAAPGGMSPPSTAPGADTAGGMARHTSNRVLTKFCRQKHFLKSLLMLCISSTSSTILFRKRNSRYCDLSSSDFVSNYSKIK